MCDAGIILLSKKDLSLERCSKMFPVEQKNTTALSITNNVGLSPLYQDSR